MATQQLEELPRLWYSIELYGVQQLKWKPLYLNIMKQIRERLLNIESHSIFEQYDLLLQSSEDIQIAYANDRSINEASLVKEIPDKIHALRYRMAYNKATDSGLKDKKLKQAWEELNKLR